jgi:hypothetical protein
VIVGRREAAWPQRRDEAEIGDQRARALRRALLGMIERHGDLAHVQAKRSRALW